MAKHRYIGGIISATQPTPTQSSASGVWTLDEAEYYQKSGNWPPGGANDPYFPYNTLLLHGDGTNGAQNNTFIDSSTNNFAITRNGNTTQGSASPYYGPGNWSNYFDGTGDYLTAPASSLFAFGTGNFTVEAWVYPTVRNATYGSQIAGCHSYLVAADWIFMINTAGNLYFQIGNSAVGAQTSLTPVALNAWSHVVVVRSSGTVTFYINGVAAGSGSYTTSVATTQALGIGAANNGSAGSALTGYISNLRIVNGAAVYTSAFTPSTTPLVSTTQTTLLTCNNNGFIDRSAANNVLTRNGDTQVSKFSPFTLYQQTPASYSGYFDGTGDYLSSATNPAYALGSGDFTVEYWAYYNTLSGSPIGFDTRSISTDIMPSDYVNTSGNVIFYYNSAALLTTSNAVTVGTWNHIAWVRSGSRLTGYINGISGGSVTTSANFGSSQPFRIGGNITAANFINGSISNFRVAKGVAVYTTNFTPSTAPLTATTTVPALTSYSTSFDGTGDYLTSVTNPAYNLNAADFTMEGWVYLNSSQTSKYLFGVGTVDGTTRSAALWVGGTGKAEGYVSADGSTWAGYKVGTTTIPTGQWTHIAFVRSGSQLQLYINGVSEGTQTGAPTTAASGYPLYVGGQTSLYQLAGAVSNVRITKGVAVYTANFTPSTSPLTATTTVSSNQSWSTSFDGTGDYLTFPQSALQFGAGDFTVEAWVYFSAIVTDQYIFNYASSGPTHVGINYYSGAWRIGGFNSYLITGGTASAGQWYHVAMVRSANTLRAYINGTQLGSTVSVSGVTFSASGIGYIGAYYLTQGNNLNGSISNLRITNGVAVYTANFTPSTSPLTATTTVPSNQSYSTSFDGTGDYLTLTSSTALPVGTENFTVEMWVYKNNAWNTGNQVLLCSGVNGSFQLWVDAATNSIKVSYLNSTAILTYSAASLSINTWYHLAVVRSGNSFALYVNGSSVTTATDTGSFIAPATIYIANYYTGAAYWNGFISNLRITKGQALYTANFTPSTSPLTTTSQGATATNVSLLTCQDNLLVDNSNNLFAVTAAGDAKPSSANPFVSTNGIGGTSYSGAFNGSSQYLTVASNAAFTFGTGDFTIEAWVYLNGTAGNYTIYDSRTAGTSVCPLLYYQGGNIISYLVNGTNRIVGPTITAYTWHHVAVTRSGTSTKMFINGAQVGSTYTDSNSYTSGISTIGHNAIAGGGANFLPGNISNFRIVKGQALYTANFTPTTSPLTTTSQGATAANVSLLTCQSTTFVDNSPNAFAITNTGTTLTDTFNPFSGATELLTCQNNLLQDNSAIQKVITPAGDARPASANPFVSTNGIAGTSYSGYFNGSQSLTLASNAAFSFGTGDFTIETWLYLAVPNTVCTIIDLRTAPTSVCPCFYFNANNTLSLLVNAAYPITTTVVFAANAWYHVALTRSGTSTKIFVNGVQSGPTYTDTNNYTSGIPTIARNAVAGGGTSYLPGYLSNFRVVKGQALYTTSFTPPTSPLTTTSQGAIAANVSLLTCQSTTFVDNSTNAFAITNNGTALTDVFNPFSGSTSLLTCQNNLLQDNSAISKAITAAGDARPASANPFVSTNGIGGASYSVAFDGAGDYLTIANNAAFNFGTGDFTVEFWLYANSNVAANARILSNALYTGSGIDISWEPAATAITWYMNTVFWARVPIPTTNTWNHVAFTRSGTTVRAFLNGVLANTYTSSNNITSANALIVGAYTNLGNSLSGNISNLRLVKGQALYTASFTPTTSPLTTTSQGATAANVSLLTCQSTTLVDNSPNAFAITATGDAKADTFNPFSGATELLTLQNTTFIDNSVIPNTLTANGDARPRAASPFTDTVSSNPTPYSTTVYGGSAYFDGTGDYLTGPASNSSIWPGSGSFTIDYWLYLPANPSTGYYTHFSYGTTGSVLRVFNTAATSKIEVFSGTSVILNPAWPNAGGWNHFALVRNGTTLTLYINGAVAQSVTNSTDFSTGTLTIGGESASNPLLGYISNFRIVKGTAVYTGPFVPPAAPLTAITNTSLLLNATNAGIFDNTGIIDLETVGAAQVSTSVVKYGTGSMSFNGTNSYLVTQTPAPPPLQFTSTADWTIEFWFYTGTSTGSMGIVDTYYTNLSPYSGFVIQMINGTINIYDGGSNRATTTTYSNSAWHHFAWVNSSGTSKIYIDGTNVTVGGVTSWSTSANISRTNSPLQIGRDYAGTIFNGYIDDMRISKYARYTTNFTPPAGPFPNY